MSTNLLMYGDDTDWKRTVLREFPLESISGTHGHERVKAIFLNVGLVCRLTMN